MYRNYNYGYQMMPRPVNQIPTWMTWTGFGLHIILTLLFWGVVIWVIASLFRHHERTSEPESLETLKTRYAKGEITKKEFEEIKKDIS